MKKQNLPVKSIKDSMLESSGKFFRIVLIWEEVTGKNAKLMMPAELKQKTLKVAVPNNIVLSAVLKFEKLMIQRINSNFKDETVLQIKFFVDPSQFKKKRSENKQKKQLITEFSQEELVAKEFELIQKFGFDEKIAETVANIELFREKNNISNNIQRSE